MCGIAGLFNNHSEIDPGHLNAMRDIVSHRGPDGKGSILFGNISSPKVRDTGPVFGGLAHRRLAIIDLSDNAKQPMTTKDGRYWITYNGEIYNHIEVRDCLKMKGYHFVSKSDTEVILYAYNEWGVDCLERFRGMFAFAIVDLYQSKLFLARDRFGIKPLYYWIAPSGSFAFGSEIKQFTVLPEWKAVLNYSRAKDYLETGTTDHTSETMFQGVSQLIGGHYIMIPLARIKDIYPKQWFFLQKQNFIGSYQFASEQFSNLFEDSVRVHLRADVDVGSCLSGGLDSSSIVCQMNKILYRENYSYRQKTFSACSEFPEVDERFYIDKVIEHVDVDPHYVYPGISHLIKDMSKIIWHQDEPFGSSSIFAQWCVFEKAHQHGIKVILDGQGADEYLLGYHSFFNVHQANVFRNLFFINWMLDRYSMKKKGYPVMPLQHFIKQNIPHNLRILLKRLIGKPNYDLSDHGYTSVEAYSRDLILKMSLPMLLRYEDRNSMAHHIEARVPFVDHPLLNFGYNLPVHYKLHRAITKRPLRTELLPKIIRNRYDKIGFATPEPYWFCEHSPNFFIGMIDKAHKQSLGFISQKHILQAKEIIMQNQPFSFLPWRVINFGEWIKTFKVSL